MMLGTDPWDLAGVAGVALITAGVWMIYRPAGLIFLGAVLVTAAILVPRHG
jgi:hypothetical protein